MLLKNGKNESNITFFLNLNFVFLLQNLWRKGTECKTINYFFYYSSRLYLVFSFVTFFNRINIITRVQFDLHDHRKHWSLFLSAIRILNNLLKIWMNIYFYSYTLFSMHFSINHASTNVKNGGVENQDGNQQEGKKNYS